jgi:hypothetical protein
MQGLSNDKGASETPRLIQLNAASFPAAPVIRAHGQPKNQNRLTITTRNAGIQPSGLYKLVIEKPTNLNCQRAFKPLAGLRWPGQKATVDVLHLEMVKTQNSLNCLLRDQMVRLPFASDLVKLTIH